MWKSIVSPVAITLGSFSRNRTGGSMSKRLIFVTALLSSVSFSSLASAADTGSSTTRQWGGLWMGFGTGYAGSGHSASGGSSEVCLTSAPSNTPSSVEQTECVVSDNTATTVAQAVARGSVQGTAINSGTSITTVALSANQGVAAVAARDDQEIAITLAIASTRAQHWPLRQQAQVTVLRQLSRLLQLKVSVV